MPVPVVIVQHAEKARHGDDPGLTPAGVAQAQAVAQALSPAGIAAIYASPLRRAQETARPISAACRVPVTTESALLERMNWTAASGLSIAEFLIEWERSSRDRDYVPPLGESSNAVATRVLRWLHQLPAQHDRLVVAVGHGGATVDALRTLLGDVELHRRAPGLIEDGVPCGALTNLIVEDDGSVHVGGIAAVDHLQLTGRHRIV